MNHPSRPVLQAFLIVHLLTGGFAAACLAGEPSSRLLPETELRHLLRAALQRDDASHAGELELQFARPMPAITVPEGPLQVRLLDLPATGLSPSFILRFELRTDRDSLGTWQIPVRARLWREVWIARASLKRGQRLSDTDRVREQRDVLTLAEAPWLAEADAAGSELAENVPAHGIVFARAVRVRPLLRRGQTVDARLEDGTMRIQLKVELLEDGAPQQRVRVRNLQTNRILHGIVHDDQTILVRL